MEIKCKEENTLTCPEQPIENKTTTSQALEQLKDTAQRDSFAEEIRSRYKGAESPKLDELFCCSHSQHIDEFLYSCNPQERDICGFLLYLHEEAVAILRLYITGGDRVEALKRNFAETCKHPPTNTSTFHHILDPALLDNEGASEAIGNSKPFEAPIPFDPNEEAKLQELLEKLFEHRTDAFQRIYNSAALKFNSKE